MANKNGWKHGLRMAAAAAVTSAVCASISYLIVGSLPNLPLLSSAKLVTSPITIIQEAAAHPSISQHSSCTPFIDAGADRYAQSPCIHVTSGSLPYKKPLAVSHKQALEGAIGQAIAALSKNEPFTSWKHAKTEVQPLGPGTHGYLVRILDRSNQSLGYFILHVNEQGDYKLTEYGAGSELPYDRLTLAEALKRSDYKQDEMKVEAIYPSALMALWKVSADRESRYFDAFTGEEIPYMEQPLTKINSNRYESPIILHASTPNSITQANKRKIQSSSETKDILSVWMPNAARIGGTFDPYENIQWMTKKNTWSKSDAARKLLMWEPISQSRLVYVHTAMKQDFQIPYALRGKQAWSAAIVEDKGSSAVLPDQNRSNRSTSYYYGLALQSNDKVIRWIQQNDLLDEGYLVPFTP